MTFRSSPRARGSRPQGAASNAAAQAAVGVPRYLGGPHKASAANGTPAYLQRTQAKLEVGPPNDTHEREADRAAAGALSPALADRGSRDLARTDDTAPSTAARTLGSHGQPLDSATREHMQARYGADLGHVRVHTGAAAATLSRDIGAKAFTQGRDVFFGAGYAPGVNEVTAHELAHVVQQTGYAGSPPPLTPLSPRADSPIQRSLVADYGVTSGTFNVNLQTRQGAVDPSPTSSGLDGYIRFVPNTAAPNSNSIVMVQIVKLTQSAGGADAPIVSVPAAQAPRGALGQPGARTQDDTARGIEGGYITDVWHHVGPAGAPGAPQGSAVSPRYPYQPAAPGTTGVVGAVAQPAQYGGGVGGTPGQTPGFKRSNDPADIRAAVLYDTPGNPDPRASVDFSFESVARGEDTMIDYGTLKWGFGLRAGRVVNERASQQDGSTATFAEAMERHRDFYVHEPVTINFEFDSAALGGGEAAKIGSFLPYLTRNPDVHLSLEGFADIRGSNAYNLRLARRRNEAVLNELLARGVEAARLDAAVAVGESTAATADAGTGDQLGDATRGADQEREANRWANRRVVITFVHVPPAAPSPAPAPAPTPAP